MAFSGSVIKKPGVVKKYNSTIVSFMLEDSHVRDRAFYSTYSSCDINNDSLFCYEYTGAASDYIYDAGSETFTLSTDVPPTGTYTKITKNPNIADYTLSSSGNAGESDVLATIKSALVEPELPENVSGMFLYLKTSNNSEIYSDGDEVLPALNIYAQVDTVPKDSDALYNFKLYETAQSINGDTTFDTVVGGLKRFKVCELPVATDLVKGFSYELYLYNEAKILDSKVIITPRKDTSGED